MSEIGSPTVLFIQELHISMLKKEVTGAVVIIKKFYAKKIDLFKLSLV
jgi:hypothetical protein